MNTDRPLDLIVFGATSFVGQIICAHLVKRHGTNGPLRWAIAGRSAEKLAQVSAETGADVERIVATLQQTAANGSETGRWARDYGLPLVEGFAAFWRGSSGRSP